MDKASEEASTIVKMFSGECCLPAAREEIRYLDEKLTIMQIAKLVK